MCKLACKPLTIYLAHVLNHEAGGGPPWLQFASGVGACKASMAVEGASPLAVGIELSKVSVSHGSPAGLGLPCLLKSNMTLAMVQNPTLWPFAVRRTLCRAFNALGPQL